jgi:hypothetical protein
MNQVIKKTNMEMIITDKLIKWSYIAYHLYSLTAVDIWIKVPLPLKAVQVITLTVLLESMLHCVV